MKTAIIFGSTGLVGSYLLTHLTDNDGYKKIISYVRKPTQHKSAKIDEVVIDFSNLNSLNLAGNDLYICLGTTMKKAGSIEQMEKIERDFPITIAKRGFEGGIKNIAVVSSMGAKSDSFNYYYRIKGEMEKGIKEFTFDCMAFARPSIILGKRNQQRLLDSIAKGFIKAIGFLLVGPLRRFRGIHANTIAKAMIRIIKENRQEITYRSDKLEFLGK
jgi:uncharacterized protein YbjT (DUF2867 family)